MKGDEKKDEAWSELKERTSEAKYVAKKRCYG